ncbi:helix-turn-helix domain-containing protein [Nitrospirillum iridis]|uniref:Transcriptional regulator with XRE-family HTH domain n=1 Tax=Nitrospirillum iridis TaxID=765888 RepID=A0A7X0B2G9_9PROT|nr:helix-turn-helix transcriptional regulator [Nitrospirillum iridis]MBB6253014.1 transcriptional regulator with XRE-family HTH domain [Nitrospirillum iridis]
MAIIIREHQEQQRKTSGAYLAQCRQDAGLVTSQVAEALGYQQRSTISQIENGQGKLRPDRWAPFAKLTGVNPGSLMARLLFWDYPEIFQALFRDASIEAAAEVINQGQERGTLLPMIDARP